MNASSDTSVKCYLILTFLPYSWLTLAPSCLNTLSFPEYHEDIWESLRKYLSQADWDGLTFLHYILSVDFHRSDGKKRPLRLFQGVSGHSLKLPLASRWTGTSLVSSGNEFGWGAWMESEVSLFAMHAYWSQCFINCLDYIQGKVQCLVVVCNMEGIILSY